MPVRGSAALPDSPGSSLPCQPGTAQALRNCVDVNRSKLNFSEERETGKKRFTVESFHGSCTNK